MHQAGGERRLGGEADLRQVGGDEIGTAADVHLGEDGAVLDLGFGAPLKIARVVQQRDHDAHRRAPRSEAVGRRAAAVMPVDEPRHGEGHVEGVPHVVIERVAAEIPGVTPGEEGVAVVEGVLQPGEVGARVAQREKPQHRLAHVRRALDVDAVGDVVLVETVLHGARRHAVARLRPGRAFPALPCGRLLSPGRPEARINPTGDGR